MYIIAVVLIDLDAKHMDRQEGQIELKLCEVVRPGLHPRKANCWTRI